MAEPKALFENPATVSRVLSWYSMGAVGVCTVLRLLLPGSVVFWGVFAVGGALAVAMMFRCCYFVQAKSGSRLGFAFVLSCVHGVCASLSANWSNWTNVNSPIEEAGVLWLGGALATLVMCGITTPVADCILRGRRRFVTKGFCDCGYNLTGNRSGRCPECGAVIDVHRADAEAGSSMSSSREPPADE